MRLYLIACLALLFVGCNSNQAEEKIVSPPFPENGINVAFLITDGVFNTELTAPFDIFHHTKFREGIEPMNVFTIAESLETITSFEGLRIQPDYAYNSEYPSIDILVIPSAEHSMDTDLENTAMLDFVRNTDKSAQFMTSHCDGAFVLAAAGLLENVECTTFPADRQAMRDMFPQLVVHDSVIFVHDDKYITSAGGAKSFEASLYLVELLYGKSNADEIAEGMVIDWQLESVPHLVIKKEE